jgi:hypothetical protein
MKFVELLKEFEKSKTRCWINGLPEKDGGIIRKIEEDYIVFEVIANKELIYIPIDKIATLSKGFDSTEIEIPTKEESLKIPIYQVLKVENGKVFVRDEDKEEGYSEYEIDKETEEILNQLTKGK